MMEGAHVPPDMLSFSLPGKGRAHKALMERSREIASYGFLVSDEPSGSVHRGFAGEALLRYDISKRDMGLMNLGIKKLAELFFAAGAEELYMPSWKLPVLRPGDDIEAVVESAGQSATYTLGDSLIVRVPGPRGMTSISITAGSARIISSPCVNQICVLAGSLSRAGDLAACVPNQVLLWLEGPRRSEFDGITR